MTTYQEQFQKAVSGEVIPAYWLGYFREAFREEINEQIASLCDSEDLSRAALARKIGRRPEQVTRWINSPSNIESDTVSDLALAFGYRPMMRLERIAFPDAIKEAEIVRSEPQSGGNVVSVDFRPNVAKDAGYYMSLTQLSTSSPSAAVVSG